MDYLVQRVLKAQTGAEGTSKIRKRTKILAKAVRTTRANAARQKRIGKRAEGLAELIWGAPPMDKGPLRVHMADKTKMIVGQA